MPENVSLELGIAQLPRLALVAFAARCTRRLLPQYFGRMRGDLEGAAQLAESVAGGGAPANASSFATRALAAAYADSPASDGAARTAGCAALLAGGIESDRTLNVLLESIESAATYAATAGFAPEPIPAARDIILTAVRNDSHLLVEAVRLENWTDETPVPAEFFGPLWPEGPPDDWPNLDTS